MTPIINTALLQAMVTTDRHTAKRWFKILVHAIMDEKRVTRLQAAHWAKGTLGYVAGYYDHETRLRVERLFHCRHPFFGKAIKGRPIHPGRAYALGKKFGERSLKDTVRDAASHLHELIDLRPKADLPDGVADMGLRTPEGSARKRTKITRQDKIDLNIARERLKEIDADPKSLVSGEEVHALLKGT